MVSEDLHGGLRVRVVGGFEAQLGDADLLEEGLDGADEVPQRQVAVRHQALDLVELTQVRRIHRFVAEHTVNAEVFLRRED